MPTENPEEGGILANMKKLIKSIRDKTSAKMKNSLESIGIFLVKDARRKTLNLGFLLGLVAAYAASFFVRRTQFYRKYDRYGIISDISTDIYIVLLFYAKFCWRKRIKLGPYSFPVQAVVNLDSFLLPVAFHKYYEISWECVCFLTSFYAAFLALLFVLRSTYSDLDFFTVILGIVADITEELTSSKHPFITWVVYGLSGLFILFKLWLDNIFLKEEEEDNFSLVSQQSENRVAGKLPFDRETLGCAIQLVALFQVWNIFVRFGTTELQMGCVNKFAPQTHGSVYYLNMVMSELMKFLPYSIVQVCCLRCLLKISFKYKLERLQKGVELMLSRTSEEDTAAGTDHVIYISIFRLLFTIWAVYLLGSLFFTIRNN